MNVKNGNQWIDLDIYRISSNSKKSFWSNRPFFTLKETQSKREYFHCVIVRYFALCSSNNNFTLCLHYLRIKCKLREMLAELSQRSSSHSYLINPSQQLPISFWFSALFVYGRGGNILFAGVSEHFPIFRMQYLPEVRKFQSLFCQTMVNFRVF